MPIMKGNREDIKEDVGSRLSLYWADSCKDFQGRGPNPRCHSVSCIRDTQLKGPFISHTYMNVDEMRDCSVPAPPPVPRCARPSRHTDFEQERRVRTSSARASAGDSGPSTNRRSGLFTCLKGNQDEEDALEMKSVAKSVKKLNKKNRQKEVKKNKREQIITDFLITNRDFLHNFLLKYVPLTELDAVTNEKKQRDESYLKQSRQLNAYAVPYEESDSSKAKQLEESVATSHANPRIEVAVKDGGLQATISCPDSCISNVSVTPTRPLIQRFETASRNTRSKSLDIEQRRLSGEQSTRLQVPSMAHANLNRSPRRASEPHKNQTDPNEIFLVSPKMGELVKNLNHEPTERQVVWELANSLRATFHLDAFRLFKVFPGWPGCWPVFDFNQQDTGMPEIMYKIDQQYQKFIHKIAGEGNCKRFTINTDGDFIPDVQYRLKKSFCSENAVAMRFVMFSPVFNIKGESIYVLEMWRSFQFQDLDVETASAITYWSSLALHYSVVLTHKTRENNMSDFLINVAKAIFNDLVDLEMLIKRILEFAQRLVVADRASLFLIDYKNNELVSTVFDLKIDEAIHRQTDISRNEIRMPISKGIAGYVATSGETVNINDAYKDERFNREVDESTGYKTKSILCMPIKVEGRTIGVVQMVNKSVNQHLEGAFSREDELNFEVFSTFFGLALQQARLYDRIRSNEQKYKVALEVLGYHNTSDENDVKILLADKREIPVDLDNFYLNPYALDYEHKCKSIIIMFDELFGMTNYDRATLTRFVLTVRKNYRNVPYHNFNHGWSVAHSMYMILKNNPSKELDTNARLALFVAALCHDLDHRGFTNKFMIDSKTPLAAMYSTATLEHHHFNITVTLLHQKGHNFLSRVGKDDFRTILKYIKKCILATDLASFFPNLTKMKTIFGEHSTTQVDWGNAHHRELAMALAMTASDLSASTKPWDIQIKTVEVIFEEFYRQGDLEKKAGRKPIPMMDRLKPKHRSPSQVDFLSHICVPCYEMLAYIMPSTIPMLLQARINYERWQAIAANSSKADSSTTDNESVSDTTASDLKTNGTSPASPERNTFTWDTEQSDMIQLANSNKIPTTRGDLEAFSWLESEVVNLRRNSK